MVDLVAGHPTQTFFLSSTIKLIMEGGGANSGYLAVLANSWSLTSCDCVCCIRSSAGRPPSDNTPASTSGSPMFLFCCQAALSVNDCHHGNRKSCLTDGGDDMSVTPTSYGNTQGEHSTERELIRPLYVGVNHFFGISC